jgi:hypothetical protein
MKRDPAIEKGEHVIKEKRSPFFIGSRLNVIRISNSTFWFGGGGHLLLLITAMLISPTVWFQGPVAEAVTQVNAKGCVFVVFARGMVHV